MNLVFQTLSKSLHPPKPYLFYGPSFSGKKTAIKGAFESLYIRPIVLTMYEAKRAPLNPIDFRGKIGYIVYLDEQLELLPKDSQLIVVYVTLDPYSLGTSEQLNSKFTLVDLSRVLKSRGTVDRELVKCPPWELFPQLASRGNYDSKLVLIERNPMFTQTLHNNLFGITLDKGKERIVIPNLEVEPIANTLEQLSMLDRSFYIEHSGEHANVLENLAIIRGLRLNGGERLDWTKKNGHNRFNTVNAKDRKRTEAALSRFSASATGGDVVKLGTDTAPKKPSKRPADSSGTNTPAKPRKAPQCKQCKVPLKGHKCPNKKPKS